jgi:hypothetical protein
LASQPKNGGGDDGTDDDNERAGQLAIHAANGEERRHADDADAHMLLRQV